MVVLKFELVFIIYMYDSLLRHCMTAAVAVCNTFTLIASL